MRLFGSLGIYLFLFILAPLCLSAQERIVHKKPKTKSVKIVFNGEKIKGMYTMIDARTDKETAEDGSAGNLKGSVVVFLPGHALRPADAWKFINDLALKSRSGIVISLVCDTPFGKNKEWRGDKGKGVILMAMVYHILADHNIMVNGYTPITDLPVNIIGLDTPQKPVVRSNLVTVGWSHGGILSRRLASLYPEAVVGMGQVCPAGYKHWRYGRFSTGIAVLGEGFRIGTKLFSSLAPDIVSAGSGFMQGVFADGMRGFWSGMIHASPGRMFRHIRDVNDVMVYMDDRNASLKKINHVIVVFGRRDTLIHFRQSGVNNPKEPKEEEVDWFWRTFYPSLINQNCERHLVFLKGDHLAPILFHDIYSSTVLKGLGQERSE